MPSFLSLPFEGALLPGIDEPDDKDRDVGSHDDQDGSRHCLENERPGKEEDHLDVKKQEEKRYQIEFDGEGIDPLLKVRAAALERLFLDGARREGPRSRFMKIKIRPRSPKMRKTKKTSTTFYPS